MQALISQFSDLKLNLLTLFGLLVIAGIIGGQLAHLTRYLPRITGYIVIGFLLGPHATNLVDQSLLNQTTIFVELAIGLALFQLGLKVNVHQINYKRKVLLTGLAESITTFFLIFLMLSLVGIDLLPAAIVAAIGVSSSPAVTILVANETNASGPVTDRSFTLTAINNIISFILFTLLLPLLHLTVSTKNYGPGYAILFPLYRLIGSVTLAAILSQFMIYMGKMIGKQENVQYALLVAMLVLSLGLANTINVSYMMTLLFLGIFVINLDRNHYLMEVEFGHSGEIFFVILFLVAGAELHINELSYMGLGIISFVIVRAIGKIIPVFILSRRNGLTKRQALSTGLTLLPMASLAIGLLNTTASISTEFASKLSIIVFGAIAILEIIGPIITVFALKRAGEVARNTQLSH